MADFYPPPSLAIYDNANSTTNWREQDLYGSSRLGMWTPNINLATGSPVAFWDTLGRKFFELTNHLGNVLATVSDRRYQVASSSVVDHFEADVKTAQSYYAFGMEMPGMTYNSGTYRFGFNGKENDNSINAGDQDYGMRIYDRRLGKFLSVDPITKKYPELTPYQFASNKPIGFIDLDGLEAVQADMDLDLDKDAYYPELPEPFAPPKTYEVPKFTPKPPAEQLDAHSERLLSVPKLIPLKKITNADVKPASASPMSDEHFTAIGRGLQKSSEELRNKQLNSLTNANDDHDEGDMHHIASDKSLVSTREGGPWTPVFQPFFDNAGLNISTAPENLVKVRDHKGPHPEAYHKIVLQRLTGAVIGLEPHTDKYRAAIINALNQLAKDAQTVGSRVNQLITK